MPRRFLKCCKADQIVCPRKVDRREPCRLGGSPVVRRTECIECLAAPTRLGRRADRQSADALAGSHVLRLSLIVVIAGGAPAIHSATADRRNTDGNGCPGRAPGEPGQAGKGRGTKPRKATLSPGRAMTAHAVSRERPAPYRGLGKISGRCAPARCAVAGRRRAVPEAARGPAEAAGVASTGPEVRNDRQRSSTLL